MSAAILLSRTNTVQLRFDLEEVKKDIADCVSILSRNPNDKSTLYRKYASEHLLARIQSEINQRKEKVQ